MGHRLRPGAIGTGIARGGGDAYTGGAVPQEYEIPLNSITLAFSTENMFAIENMFEKPHRSRERMRDFR